MTTPLEGYAPERALVVFNEYSSNARRMARQLLQLEIPLDVIPTHPDMRYTEEAMARSARPGHVILMSGGDGTANQGVNIMMGDAMAEKELNWLPFVPLRGGNANDIAVMLNGKDRPDRILSDGHYFSVSPLEVTKTSPEGDRDSRYALGYFSVGATAAASRRLDEIKETANRFTKAVGFQQLREAVATWRVVGHYPALKVAMMQEETPLSLASDVLFLRGNRIAKYGRPHANLGRQEYEMVMSNPDGMTATLVDMLKLQRGRILGTMATAACFGVETADGSPFEVQYDGEWQPAESGSDFLVRISDKSFNTISTQLAA